ncbi:MAG: CpaF family protein, partial [Gemmatimonadota bacterium]|nr:CpaF family protein [Gemmatimonadota bacterium]
MNEFAGPTPRDKPGGLSWMPGSTPPPVVGSPTSAAGDLQEIKVRIHRQLLDRLNLSSIESLAREEVVGEIRKVVHELLTREAVPLNLDEREDLVEQILDEIFGLGPIEPLLKD